MAATIVGMAIDFRVTLTDLLRGAGVDEVLAPAFAQRFAKVAVAGKKRKAMSQIFIVIAGGGVGGFVPEAAAAARSQVAIGGHIGCEQCAPMQQRGEGGTIRRG